jgi:hypothetical protein
MAAPAANPASARDVGVSFVRTYSKTLEQDPSSLALFFKADSVYSYSEVDGEAEIEVGVEVTARSPLLGSLTRALRTSRLGSKPLVSIKGVLSPSTRLIASTRSDRVWENFSMVFTKWAYCLADVAIRCLQSDIEPESEV